MSNTEWNRQSGEYARWGEDVHVHHTFEEEEYEETTDEEYDEETTEEEYEETTDEEEEREDYSFYEEMLADSFISDVSYAVGTMKLSVPSAPRLTITEGVPITFNYSDKATVTQEVTDGQLTLTIQENIDLQSIKICGVDNRTWVIPLDTFPISPPSMPKKR